jgi:hypothetical protein
METTWEPLSIDELRERFGRFDVPWWVAGGVSIDLFLGYTSRHHDDIDVEMLRRDRDLLFDAFEGWDLHIVSDGALEPWRRGDPIDAAVFGVWGRPEVGAPWAVEVMLADGDDDTWRFRRDPEITMAMAALVSTTSDGVPFCTPEVQLLYKAKQHRAKDDADLTRCLHRLTDDQATWLAAAIGRSQPDHPWIGVLANSTRMRSRSR